MDYIMTHSHWHTAGHSNGTGTLGSALFPGFHIRLDLGNALFICYYSSNSQEDAAKRRNHPALEE